MSLPAALDPAHAATDISSPPAGLLARVASLPALLATALLFLVWYSSIGRLNDPDTWWHLRLGADIWNGGSLPRTDTYSFTTNNHPWVPHEWLAEISIYCAYSAGGYRGLVLWLIAVAGATIAGVYCLCWAVSGNPKTSLVGGLIAWYFSTVTIAVRPLMLGSLFLTALLLVLWLGRERNPRWLWSLPPLFAIWVNCHGSFAFGLGVLAVDVGFSFLTLNWGLVESRPWEPCRRKTLVAALLASAGALFVNPIGWQLVVYPFDVFVNQSTNLEHVYEWRSLDFHDPRGMMLFAVCGWIVLMLLIRRQKIAAVELCMLALGSYLALRHMRMLPIFGLLAAPIVCRLIRDDWDRYNPAIDPRRVNAAIIAALLVVMVWRFPTAAELGAQVESANPAAAVAYLREGGLTEGVLNEYDWGGYLLWAAPEIKTFVDDRTDIFEWSGVLYHYAGFAKLALDPVPILEKYGVKTCLLAKDSPAAHALAYLPGWREVYSDERAVIFIQSPAPISGGP
jgi:hypothetical protein